MTNVTAEHLTDRSKPATIEELDDAMLSLVSGGINPQPLPPRHETLD